MDTQAELEVPLDPGNLDAEQFHGGGSCPGSHVHPQSTLHQQEVITCHPQSPDVQDCFSLQQSVACSDHRTFVQLANKSLAQTLRPALTPVSSHQTGMPCPVHFC